MHFKNNAFKIKLNNNKIWTSPQIITNISAKCETIVIIMQYFSLNWGNDWWLLWRHKNYKQKNNVPTISGYWNENL